MPATIDFAPKITQAKVSGEVVITCSAVGNLPIDLKWFNGTKQMAENSRVTISTSTEEKDYRVNSTLVVRRLVLEDTRQYSCRVVNEYGIDTRTFQIIAQRKNFSVLITSTFWIKLSSYSTFNSCVEYR